MPEELAPGYVNNGLREPHEALYRQISLTARDLRRVLNEDFRAWGLSGAQFGVLLGASAGGSITDIAEQLLTDATSVGRMIERMEAAGLVERVRDVPDRRVVWVRLRPRGEGLLRAILPMHVARCREMLGFLDTTEREQLAHLLEKVRASIVAARVSVDNHDDGSVPTT